MAPLDDVIAVAEFRAQLRHFLSQADEVSARHGLTPQRYLLLLMIKGAPDGTECSTVTELARRLQLAPHTVTGLVARAEKAGLVRREVSAADRRKAHVRLTAKGEHKLAASFRELEAEREALRRLLAVLARTPARFSVRN